MDPDYIGLKAEDARPAYQDMADAARVAAINAPTAVQAPVALAESAMAALLTDPANGSLVKLLNYVNFSLVKADIERNNHAGCLLWCSKLQLLGIVTAGEAGALAGYIDSTEAVPGPSIANGLGFPSVTENDLAHARSL